MASRTMVFKPIITATLAAGALLLSPNALAIGLMQAYEAALSNDPTYQAARHENEAGQQNRAIGRASLLPTISATYSASKNKLTEREYTPDGGATVTQEPVDYSSNVAAISLRQPLVNFDGIARYQQGSAQASYSGAVFSGKSQELIIRVVTAYAEAQYAENQVALATAQRDAYAEQMKVNKRMFEFGEATVTDMLETQAKAELAEAQVIESMDSAATARNTLAGIIGKEVTHLDDISNNFPIQPMTPATIDEWKTLAMEKSAELVSQRHAVEAARQEVNKNRAGHFPRLDAVASYSDAKSETVNTYNQEYRARSIGVQLNIPLFSGGYTNAVTNQAAANHAKAKSELDAKTNQVIIELRKQYGLVTSSAARIQALEKAVESAKTLITATEKSIQGGVRINLDLLNAQQQLYTAQRDLAQARYNYLLAYLKLRYTAGILTHDDLRVVASYYTPTPVDSQPSDKGLQKEVPKQDGKTLDKLNLDPVIPALTVPMPSPETPIPQSLPVLAPKPAIETPPEKRIDNSQEPIAPASTVPAPQSSESTPIPQPAPVPEAKAAMEAVPEKSIDKAQEPVTPASPIPTQLPETPSVPPVTPSLEVQPVPPAPNSPSAESPAPQQPLPEQPEEGDKKTITPSPETASALGISRP